MDISLKKRGLFVAALTAVLLLASLVPAGAFQQPAQRSSERYLSKQRDQAAGVLRGKASWFSASHGYCTKHMSGYYAASRTLPCGTRISVSSGGRSVVVTIQDRGPYVSGRILDLSKTAFRKLAPLGSGVITVTATRLSG